MAMTKQSMAAFIISHLDNVNFTQFEGGGGQPIQEKRREYLEALCQGIIDEIQTNMEILTSGPHSGHSSGDGTHTHAIDKAR